MESLRWEVIELFMRLLFEGIPGKQGFLSKLIGKDIHYERTNFRAPLFRMALGHTYVGP